MSDDRTKVLQRILNLRAKADNDASSEAEAMAAIERAERLMHGYRIEEAELAMAEATGRIKIEIVHLKAKSMQVGSGSWRKRTRHVAINCQWQICALTGTQCVNYNGVYPEFTGNRVDVEYAVFLQELIAEALDREYDRYKRTQKFVGRGAKRTFQIEMSRRINARLLEMTRARKAEAKAAKAEEAKRLSVDLSVIESMVVPEARAELTSTAMVLLAYDEQVYRDTTAAYKARHPRLRSARGFGISGGYNGTAGDAGGRRATGSTSAGARVLGCEGAEVMLRRSTRPATRRRRSGVGPRPSPPSPAHP